MHNFPSLSLVIVTYNREDELLSVLHQLSDDFSLFHEIIIVDNGQSEALRKTIRESYSQTVEYIRPKSNLGAVGRSVGILKSKGDIVITLDDDVRIPEPQQLMSLPHLLNKQTKIGCINFKIKYTDTKEIDLSDWCHPRDPGEFFDSFFDTNYISEGACAFNGELVRSLGGYSLDLFIGQEGVELASRIIDSGYSIHYTPSIIVEHSVSKEGRISGRQFYYNARNIYMISLRCYPVGLMMRTMLREWLLLFAFSIVKFRVNHFAKGCFDGLIATKIMLKSRSPIAKESVKKIALLNRMKPNIIIRTWRVINSRTFE